MERIQLKVPHKFYLKVTLRDPTIIRCHLKVCFLEGYTGLTVCTDVRMYGFFFGNSQKCTELGIRISVHDDFNPCTDKCKSVHGNPYIRTFYGDYCIKMAFFLPFFRIFFCFLPIFSKFSRFAQIYNIYSMISNEFLII